MTDPPGGAREPTSSKIASRRSSPSSFESRSQRGIEGPSNPGTYHGHAHGDRSGPGPPADLVEPGHVLVPCLQSRRSSVRVGLGVEGGPGRRPAHGRGGQAQGEVEGAAGPAVPRPPPGSTAPVGRRAPPPLGRRACSGRPPALAVEVRRRPSAEHVGIVPAAGLPRPSWRRCTGRRRTPGHLVGGHGHAGARWCSRPRPARSAAPRRPGRPTGRRPASPSRRPPPRPRGRH